MEGDLSLGAGIASSSILLAIALLLWPMAKAETDYHTVAVREVEPETQTGSDLAASSISAIF
jgi:hypothetical protein